MNFKASNETTTAYTEKPYRLSIAGFISQVIKSVRELNLVAKYFLYLNGCYMKVYLQGGDYLKSVTQVAIISKLIQWKNVLYD